MAVQIGYALCFTSFLQLWIQIFVLAVCVVIFLSCTYTFDLMHWRHYSWNFMFRFWCHSFYETCVISAFEVYYKRSWVIAIISLVSVKSKASVFPLLCRKSCWNHFNVWQDKYRTFCGRKSLESASWVIILWNRTTFLAETVLEHLSCDAASLGSDI